MSKSDYVIHPSVSPRKTVYQNAYMEVYKVRLDFGEFAKDLFVSDYGHRVGVVVEGRNGILLTRQYRYLIDNVSWEVPGGKVDPGESMEEAARRECVEETGIACHGLKPLLMFHQGLDTAYNPSHLYCTKDYEEKIPLDALNTNEVVGRDWIPLEKCIEMIANRTIVDSLSVIAILSYRVYGK